MATENLSNLKINMLTKAQFDAALAAGNINENEIYNTIDEIDEDNGGGGIGIELVVTTTAGATVYYTDESGISKYEVVDDSGSVVINIPDYGTYSIYAQKPNGTQSIETVSMTFDAIKRYKLTLSFYNYYGVKIDRANSDPAAAVTYIDDAVGMSTGWDAWKHTSIFKNIKPCVLKDGIVQYYLQKDNYTLREDGVASTLTDYTNGNDVMVEIPKLGYKMTKDDNYQYIWVTDDPNADEYCYLAHSKNTDGDCDKIYIGAYLGFVSSSKLYSVSDNGPSSNIKPSDFRTYAKARGDGYELFSFYPLTLLQCLFLIMFKNRDSQTALGKGYTGSGIYGAPSSNGTTNSNTFVYGSTSSTISVKFLGIENFWGDMDQYIDGIKSDGSLNILTYYKNMNSEYDDSDYQYKTPTGFSKTGDYPSGIIGTNNGGFVPNEFNGSTSTYYCDYGVYRSNKFAFFGGDWYSNNSSGAFRLCISHDAGSSYSDRSARLVYKHLAS